MKAIIKITAFVAVIISLACLPTTSAAADEHENAAACSTTKPFSGEITELTFGFIDLGNGRLGKVDYVTLDKYPRISFACFPCDSGPFHAVKSQGNVGGVAKMAGKGDRVSIFVDCPAIKENLYHILKAKVRKK